MSILKRLFTFAMVVFLLAASGAGAQEPDVPPPDNAAEMTYKPDPGDLHELPP